MSERLNLYRVWVDSAGNSDWESSRIAYVNKEQAERAAAQIGGGLQRGKVCSYMAAEGISNDRALLSDDKRECYVVYTIDRTETPERLLKRVAIRAAAALQGNNTANMLHALPLLLHAMFPNILDDNGDLVANWERVIEDKVGDIE